MRILLLNQYYRPDVAATGQLLANLAKDLADRGHEVHVICSQRSYGGGNTKYLAYEVMDNVHVHRVGASGFGRGKLIGRLADYLSFYLLALCKAILLPRMNVCVALTTPPFIGLIGFVLKVLKGTSFTLWTMDLYPEIAVVYGLLRPDSLLHRLLLWLNKKLYSKASHIISLGEVMSQRLLETGADPNKIVTVHNWAPEECVNPKTVHRPPLGNQLNLDSRITLMYSGNLGLGHDLETVLSAVHSLDKKQNLRVLFVGNGKVQKSLEKLAEELDLSCIDFCPPVPLERLSDSLAGGDIHIVSQKPGTEGLIVPSKLYGIMAAGRPTLFIGPPECESARIIVKSGAGIIVPPGDEKAVSQAIDKLVNDYELRVEMGKRAQEYYKQHFGRNRSVPCIIQAIEVTTQSQRQKKSKKYRSALQTFNPHQLHIKIQNHQGISEILNP